MTTERRKEGRTPIALSIDVEDEYFNEKIGKLVDISPKGLRTIGPDPIEVNDELKLCLHLPEQILGKRTIRLTAECVWSMQEPETGHWLNGFEFSSVSEHNSSLIIGLIMENRETE